MDHRQKFTSKKLDDLLRLIIPTLDITNAVKVIIALPEHHRKSIQQWLRGTYPIISKVHRFVNSIEISFSTFSVQYRTTQLYPVKITGVWDVIVSKLPHLVTSITIERPLSVTDAQLLLSFHRVIEIYASFVDLGAFQFHPSWSLHKISLRGCQLDHVPANLWTTYRDLRFLDLSFNEITALPNTKPAFINQILNADLSHNMLSTALPDYFSEACNLIILNVAGNKLSSVLRDFPNRLREIDVTGNANITDVLPLLQASMNSRSPVNIFIGSKRARCRCNDETNPKQHFRCEQTMDSTDNE